MPEAPLHSTSPSLGLRHLDAVVTPLVLTTIGVICVVFAWLLLPNRPEVTSPPTTTVSVESTAPVGLITYSVSRQSDDRAALSVELDVFPGTPNYPPKTPASVLVFLPQGTRPVTCPRLKCIHLLKTYSWHENLRFDEVGSASVRIEVRGHDFGYRANGAAAAVALPRVTYRSAANSQVQTHVALPGASGYDWSSYPTSFVEDRQAVWDTSVNAGEVPARIATGVNRAAVAHDERMTFVGGAVVGLAGGAIIGAVQESLHGWGRRRHRPRRGLSS